MKSSWPFCGLFISVVLLLLFGRYAGAQNTPEDLLRAQQSWKIDCMPKGCIASVDILRGESGDPPDPHDTSQYISVAIGVNRSDRRPSLVMFEVDSKADKNAGVDLVFAHTVADGKSWKIIVDQNGIYLPFRRCDATKCSAVLGGGKPDCILAMKSCADLIARMQSEDHLFLSYRRRGRPYRTAVSLALFKEAYARLLTQVSAAQENPSVNH